MKLKIVFAIIGVVLSVVPLAGLAQDYPYHLIFDRYVESPEDYDIGYALATLPLPILRAGDPLVPMPRNIETWNYMNDNNLLTSLMLPHESRPRNLVNPGLFRETLTWLSTEDAPKIDLLLTVVEETGMGGIGQTHQEIDEIIEIVRQNPNPAINQMRIGAYVNFPGNIDISQRWPHLENRTLESDFYLNSGLSVANPSCYPYMTLSSHTSGVFLIPLGGGKFEDRRSPSKRSALFWAPIEKVTVAKKSLPEGHLLIPYVSGYVVHPNVSAYGAPVPARSDIITAIKHMRLRGADGYRRTFKFLDAPDVHTEFDLHKGSTNHWWYSHNSWIKQYSDTQYSNDLADAWASLDPYFGNEKFSRINSEPDPGNRYSEKTSGFIYSGIRYVNSVLFLASNTGRTQNFSVEYNDRFNLNVVTPPVPATGPGNGIADHPDADLLEIPSHATFRYKIQNLIRNGDFEQGSAGWNFSNAHLNFGQEGNQIVNLGLSNSSISTSQTNCADIEPGANMKIQIDALGSDALLDCRFKYEIGDGNFGYFDVDNWGEMATREQAVSNPSLRTFVGRFQVPQDALSGTKISLILLDRAESQSLKVDNIVIKFAEGKNLIATGDFDNSLAGWWHEANAAVELQADSDVDGNRFVALGAGANLFAISFNEIPLEGESQNLILGFQAKGQGTLEIAAQQFDADGNLLPNELELGTYPILNLKFSDYYSAFIPDSQARRLRLVFRNVNGDMLGIDEVQVNRQ